MPLRIVTQQYYISNPVFRVLVGILSLIIALIIAVVFLLIIVPLIGLTIAIFAGFIVFLFSSIIGSLVISNIFNRHRRKKKFNYTDKLVHNN